MATMRAKFRVIEVQSHGGTATPPMAEGIKMMAVSDAPFDKMGMSEDNSFAMWTPSGVLEMTITNPNLFGQLKVGDKYYLDFTRADS